MNTSTIWLYVLLGALCLVIVPELLRSYFSDIYSQYKKYSGKTYSIASVFIFINSIMGGGQLMGGGGIWIILLGHLIFVSIQFWDSRKFRFFFVAQIFLLITALIFFLLR